MADLMEDNNRLLHVVRPHDLLWLASAETLTAPCVLPPWVEEASAAMPVVVVRRAVCQGDKIPVGVRGRTRSERFATFVSPRAVCRRVTPEELANEMRWRGIRRPEFATIRRTLDTIATRWNALGCAWGPAGSVGFELATGVTATTSESDLDLVIRASRRLAKKDAEALLQSANGLEVPADIRIETPFGSVALKEYARSPRVLMKTCDGPKRVKDPWLDPRLDPRLDPFREPFTDPQICLSRSESRGD